MILKIKFNESKKIHNASIMLHKKNYYTKVIMVRLMNHIFLTISKNSKKLYGEGMKPVYKY